MLKKETREALKIAKEKKKMEHMKVPKCWKERKIKIAHISKTMIKKRERHDQRSTKIFRIRNYL